ncbi:MAG: phosphotransferase [Anaerolineales bacterium]|nr:phosphotransferase [Anaerolineales bacterium]
MATDVERAVLASPIASGRTAEIYALGKRQIIKLFLADFSAQAADREAMITRLVGEAGVRAPVVGQLVTLSGRRGIVFERIDGPSLMENLTRQPGSISIAAHHFATVHAAMHLCPLSELPPQKEYLAQAIEHAPGLTPVQRTAVLAQLAVMPGGQVVCHGDFHPGNVISSAHGLVTIDWMTGTSGNPLADVARTVLMLRVAALPPGLAASQRLPIERARGTFLNIYLRGYRQQHEFDQKALDAWLPIVAAARLAEQIPGEEQALLAMVKAIA